LSKEKGIIGGGPKETGSLEHRFILLDIREGQGDALVQVPSCPICSLLGRYFDQPVPSAWDDWGPAPSRSPFVSKTWMHIGFLERNFVTLGNNYPPRIWITHWT